jgi:predicted DNA-binding transcriptional regulator YafY
MRTYRISRIQSASLTEESFIRSKEFVLAAYWEQSTQAFKEALPNYSAVLSMQEQLLPRLRKTRYVKIIETRIAEKSGWHEVNVEFNTLESASEIILSYSPYIKVKEPQELRSAILLKLQESLALYD